MDRSSITPEVQAGVRPPDERDAASPETLPASAVKANRGAAGDTDVTDLTPRTVALASLTDASQCPTCGAARGAS